MTTITEADVEQVALVWLSGLGLQVAHGADIGADIGSDAPGVEQTGGVGTNKLSDEPMDRNGPRIRQSNPRANKRTVDVGLMT